MILTKEQALRGSKRIFETVQVPELDGELRLASISAGTSLRLRGLQERKTKGEDVEREIVLVFLQGSVVDEQNRPLFDADSAGQFLDQISPEVVQTLIAKASKLVVQAPTVPPGNSAGSPSAA